MGQETTRAQHPDHFRNAMAASSTVAELDLVWATRAGGLNQSMWDDYGHYFGKHLMQVYNDKRVKLGGASKL